VSAVAGRLVEVTPMRAAIARRMSDSQRNVPHFYVATEIATASTQAYVEELSRTSGVRVSMTAALVRACALALAQHPIINAVWSDEGLVVAEAVNIGVAVALDDGLVAPALLGCSELDILAIAARLSDLVERARARKLRAPEMTDATFTLSNLGMFDVTSFGALVTPPQVAILAAGRSIPRALVAEDGSVTTTPVMIATLSADHRAVDGADAARFLGALKSALESPEALAHTTLEAAS
jgi:pyruvate dehydrogenase E2 component (dihydrolipoamide acetyltransferase)